MDNLQTQIDNLKTLQESYSEVAQAAEAYNVGKTELAANITAKGVQASASETLPELAEKVSAIAQESYTIDGGEMYSAQLFGDGALWNLYQVLADMKTRWLGTGDYAALIVCEYYKGYDSLQLQGADGYYTCDGDYYDYASPNHIWHDSDNGKANRWVCFLYHDEGARLDITNTAISPRSMYIGGHIGTIEYFVDGRLTDLVCGVEDTDIVDNFLSKTFTQSWGFNSIIRNVGTFGAKFITLSAGTVILDVTSIPDDTTSGNITASNCTVLEIPNIISISKGGTSNITISVGSNCVEISLKKLTYLTQNNWYFISGTLSGMQRVNLESLVSFISNSTIRFIGTGATKLIDLIVGELITNFAFSTWNPTNVLADADKKAQLIENIKNHILARVSDATGSTQLVFTISTNMYNEVASETIEWQGETMTLADAFLTKNWLMAGA